MTTARLAGFATRVIALLIDGAILVAAVSAVGACLSLAASVVGLELHDSAVVAGLAALGWVLLASSYLVSFWSLTGQTPGMRFMGIRVVGLDGGTLGRACSLRRLVGMVLAALPAGAGFLLVLVDDDRRGLHDRIGRSLVVHVARERRITSFG